MLRLRAIREQRGLSLRELKKVSGVAVSALAKFEAGVGDPRLSTLRKLAKALRVSVAALIVNSKPGKGVKK
jgi:transcriptional regulator with XRE-family HTH domain